MIRTEVRRLRSFSFTAEGRCRHPPKAAKARGFAEAEQLLSHTPLKEAPEGDDEELEALLAWPDLPSASPNHGEETKLASLASLTAAFKLTDAHLLHIEQRMLEEVNRGLSRKTNAEANVKSLITYVHSLPTGKEEGRFVALDLGGTNFRVILVTLDADSRSIKMKSCKHEVSQELMLGPGTDLFNFMVDCLYRFLHSHNLLQLLQEPLHLGFTFSFPIRMRGIARAELSHWTKGFVCSGVEGQDVVGLLEAALLRRPELHMIKVVAILNDTTGCLLACAYKRPECRVGVIFGTGTNACYEEDMSMVELYEGEPPPGARKVIINTEWGAFGNTGSLDLIRTPYDRVLDNESRNPGKQVYEKLISGMYLGELTRLILQDAIAKSIIFDGQDVKLERGCFLTRHISHVEAENRDSYENAREVLTELGISAAAVTVTDFDCRVIRYVCECVSSRASLLAGAGVASLINKIGRRKITVGMDGSVYKCHPYFGLRMQKVVQRLVCDCIEFELVLSEDGSGRGAALAAAVAAQATNH